MAILTLNSNCSVVVCILVGSNLILDPKRPFIGEAGNYKFDPNSMSRYSIMVTKKCVCYFILESFVFQNQVAF